MNKGYRIAQDNIESLAQYTFVQDLDSVLVALADLSNDVTLRNLPVVNSCLRIVKEMQFSNVNSEARP